MSTRKSDRASNVLHWLALTAWLSCLGWASTVFAQADAPEAAQESNASESSQSTVGGFPSGARILFVTQSEGWRHEAVTRTPQDLSLSERVMTELGVRSGLFRVDCTQDVANEFTRDQLDNTDIVMFYTTGNLPIEPEVLDYFLTDWIKQPGHGFIGTHSAADTFHEHEPYWEMMGGTFVSHPWNADSTVTVTVHDTSHPVSKPWGEEFVIQDEIYRFRNWQPEKVRVLMSLNMEKTELQKPYHVPIAWAKQYGEGRVVHMSLGHREDVWTNPTYQESLLGAVKWILGMEEGVATPNPDVSAAQHAQAVAVAPPEVEEQRGRRGRRGRRGFGRRGGRRGAAAEEAGATEE